LKECEDDAHTLEMGTWESSETPKNSKLDCRGQNTSPWSVIYTVGKVLKRRCRKWPHMNHLNIYSTIWLPTTKSQESTRPRCVQVEYNTPLERSQKELQVCFRPHPNRRSEQGVMSCQSPMNPNPDNFRTPFWESREKVPFGCRCGEVTQRILYGGRWWLPSSSGCGESCESKVARGLS
jgi:hypothetical protein